MTHILQPNDKGATPDVGHWPTPGTILVDSYPASDKGVKVVLNAKINDGNDGRSEWRWFRLPEGTLILGCFPQGETYFEIEPFVEADYTANHSGETA